MYTSIHHSCWVKWDQKWRSVKMPEDDFPGVSQRPLGHYGRAALSSGEQTLISPENATKIVLIGRQPWF